MSATKTGTMGVRVDGGDLKVALGAQCPAGVTYTVMFDRDNLKTGSQSKTEVFTSSVPLTVFDPFHLPPGTAVLTPFPAGFQWQDAQGVDIQVKYADGTEGYHPATDLGRIGESAQHPPATYFFVAGWYTIDQALAKPNWVTACSPK